MESAVLRVLRAVDYRSLILHNSTANIRFPGFVLFEVAADIEEIFAWVDCVEDCLATHPEEFWGITRYMDNFTLANTMPLVRRENLN